MTENPTDTPMPAPEAKRPDWFATGLATLAQYGEDAVELAAAVLQLALSEMLRVSPERRILTKETTHSARRLALEAIGAHETAGGLYQKLLRKMTPADRAQWDSRLRQAAAGALNAHHRKAPLQ